MTSAEIKQRALEQLDEDATTSQRYVSATLSEYLVDGIRFYVARTGCQNNTTTITADANVLLYDLPCDCIQVERVLWQGASQMPLDAVTPRILDREQQYWQTQVDTRSRAYFLLGLTQIALWPVSTTGGEDYVVHYQQDKYDSVTRVPVEDHECLVDYVKARCLLSEGKVADGAMEYKKYRACVEAAQRRMASVDRTWAMGRLG